MEKKIRMLISRNVVSLILLTALGISAISMIFVKGLPLTQINSSPVTGYFTFDNISLSGDVIILSSIILVLFGLLVFKLLRR